MTRFNASERAWPDFVYMDDAGDIELRNGFVELSRCRKRLKQAADPRERARLYTRIRETEDKMAQLRREVYRPVIRD